MSGHRLEIATIRKAGASKRIITCPHCQNTVQVKRSVSQTDSPGLIERLNLMRSKRKSFGRKFSATPHVLSVLDQLPETFQLQDVINACAGKASERTVRNVLNKLRKAGTLVYCKRVWIKAEPKVDDSKDTDLKRYLPTEVNHLNVQVVG